MIPREDPAARWIVRILLLLVALSVLAHWLSAGARAQEGFRGHHGVGHERWHGSFYSKLVRKDGKSCCNLTDCVPTQSRMTETGYEVLVEGEWTPVPSDTIQPVTAPDGGAHVCFPKQPHPQYPKGTLFCVVLPPEG